MTSRVLAPDGLVHVWLDHDRDFLEEETVCEYRDNRLQWPRGLLKLTDEPPTCVRCVARWT